MNTFVERLTRRMEEEICHVCVHRTADGGCTLTERRECPIYEWTQKIAELVARTRSDRMEDYLDRIQEIICPQCFRSRGLPSTPEDVSRCEERTHLDCPLDLYLGLLIPIVEDELQRLRRSQAAPGNTA